LDERQEHPSVEILIAPTGASSSVSSTSGERFESRRRLLPAGARQI